MRHAFAVLSLALLLVPATGCGSQAALELDPVAQAASRTSEAGSSRVAFEATMVAAGKTIAVSGEGVFAYDEVRNSTTMELSSVLPGEGDRAAELRLLGSTMYLRLPESLSAGLPQGKDWLAIDVEKAFVLAGLAGLDLSQLQQDPTQTLRLLRASSTGVEEAGKADVRGTETTRYTATLDLEKALEASADELGLGEQQREELRIAAERLQEQAGVAKVPIEVFVDDGGLLRRVLLKLSFAVAGEQASASVRSDYYDFGVDVDVAAPPAAHVLDVTDKLGAYSGG